MASTKNFSKWNGVTFEPLRHYRLLRKARPLAAAFIALVWFSIPAIAAYGAGVLWISASGNTPLREGAMVVLALWLAADMLLTMGPTKAAVICSPILAICVGASTVLVCGPYDGCAQAVVAEGVHVVLESLSPASRA